MPKTHALALSLFCFVGLIQNCSDVGLRRDGSSRKESEPVYSSQSAGSQTQPLNQDIAAQTGDESPFNVSIPVTRVCVIGAEAIKHSEAYTSKGVIARITDGSEELVLDQNSEAFKQEIIEKGQITLPFKKEGIYQINLCDAKRESCRTGNEGFFSGDLLSKSEYVNVTRSGLLQPSIQEIRYRAGHFLTDKNCDIKRISPLVIDFSNAGIQLTSQANGVLFDLDADGEKEQISWPAMITKNNYAFLVADFNGNGKIDDGSELFGNFTANPSSGYFENGFKALASFDENGDKILNSKDPLFAKLRLWFDLNADGQSSPDELANLADKDITSFALEYRNIRLDDEFGNQIRQFSFMKQKQSSKLVFDVWFQISNSMILSKKH